MTEKPAWLLAAIICLLSVSRLCAQEVKPVWTLRGHSEEIRCVAFSPDGSILGSAGAHDHTVRLWEVRTGKEAGILRTGQDAPESISFSPDGKMLAVGNVGFIVNTWDLTTLKRTVLRDAMSQCLRTMVLYSPNGKMLAAASLCDREIPLWNMTTGKRTLIIELRKDGGGHGVKAMAFSRDSKELVTVGEDNQIKFWNIAAGNHLGTLDLNEEILHASFASDGKTLATLSEDNQPAGGRRHVLRVRDLETGKEPVTLKRYTDGDSTSCMKISPNGRFLALGRENGEIKLWDAEKEKVIATLRGHTGLVKSLAFSANSKLLASGSDDRMVMLWELVSSN
jgi:WD40 repeat protein